MATMVSVQDILQSEDCQFGGCVNDAVRGGRCERHQQDDRLEQAVARRSSERAKTGIELDLSLLADGATLGSARRCKTEGCPNRANGRYSRGPYSGLCEETCIEARRLVVSQATKDRIAARKTAAAPTHPTRRSEEDTTMREEPPTYIETQEPPDFVETQESAPNTEVQHVDLGEVVDLRGDLDAALEQIQVEEEYAKCAPSERVATFGEIAGWVDLAAKRVDEVEAEMVAARKHLEECCEALAAHPLIKLLPTG